MKTQKCKIVGIFVILFFMFALTPSAKAQCVNIANSLSCPVQLQFTIMDCKTNVCLNYSTTVAPGASYPLGCGGCSLTPGTVCNVMVNVYMVGSVSTPGFACNMSTAAPGVSYVGIPPCAGSPTTGYLFYDSVTNTFVIQY